MCHPHLLYCTHKEPTEALNPILIESSLLHRFLCCCTARAPSTSAPNLFSDFKNANFQNPQSIDCHSRFEGTSNTGISLGDHALLRYRTEKVQQNRFIYKSHNPATKGCDLLLQALRKIRNFVDQGVVSPFHLYQVKGII